MTDEVFAILRRGAIKAGAHEFADPPRPMRALADFKEAWDHASQVYESTAGLLAPDPLHPRHTDPPKLDHELVMKVGSTQPVDGAKNLQACAAGSHDWGPYLPDEGYHECMSCGMRYTRRA